jgi:cytochrome b561
MMFHWLVALLIFVNIGLVWATDFMAEDSIRPMIDLHKSIGITVLGLALMRLLWRFANPPPPLPASYPARERIGAHVAHAALYVLILAMPLSGWLHDSAWKGAATHPMTLFGFIPWFRIGAVENLDPTLKEQLHGQFGALHTWLSYVLYALVVLHVAGALKHQFIDGHPELQRMLPWGRRSAALRTQSGD